MGKFNNDDGPRGRGGDRPPFNKGGKPGGFSKGPRGPPRNKVFVQPHRLPGIYVARGPKDALVTKNLIPG